MLSASKLIVPALLVAGIAAGPSFVSAAGAPAACAAADAPASIARVVPVDVPPLLAQQPLDTSAVVQLDLDENSTPHNPAIVKSSGSAVLDDAARKAALDQSYAPQKHDCAPVAGSYRLVIEFRNPA